MGFVPTISDPRLYVQFYSDGTRAYISVHVDDLGIAATTTTIIEIINLELQKLYKLEFNTDFIYYVGMFITRDRNNRVLRIPQPGYISDLTKTCIVDTTSFSITPMLDIPCPPESKINPILNID